MNFARLITFSNAPPLTVQRFRCTTEAQNHPEHRVGGEHVQYISKQRAKFIAPATKRNERQIPKDCRFSRAKRVVIVDGCAYSDASSTPFPTERDRDSDDVQRSFRPKVKDFLIPNEAQPVSR